MKMLCVFAAVMLPLCLVSCANSPPAVELGDDKRSNADAIDGGIDFGDDSSEWAHNGECDDPRFTGLGAASKLLWADRFRDASDCRILYQRGEIRLLFADASPAPIPDLDRVRVSRSTRIVIDGIDFGDSSGGRNGRCDDPRFSGPSSINLIESMRFRDATDCSELYQSGQVQLVADTRGAALPLQSGQRQQGRLESGAAYPDRYRYQGSAGDTIVVDLQEARFNPYFFYPYLTLVTPSGERLRYLDSFYDDDPKHVRLTLVLAETGEYQVEVAGYDTDVSGAYTLTLSRLTVIADHEYEGMLDSTDVISDKEGYVDTYTFEGKPGQLISIELGSDDFRTFLALRAPDGTLETNKFTSCRYSGCSENYRYNNLIEQERSLPGTYTVRVTSSTADETGAYHLRIVQSEVSN
jgi:hypothetical protein